MGLDTTHDCWHGAYSRFNRWRTMLAEISGMPPLENMVGFGGVIEWDSLEWNELHILLNHSDCDDEIRWQLCEGIADRLSELMPKIDQGDWCYATHAFIDGLRKAAAAQENVEFG